VVCVLLEETTWETDPIYGGLVPRSA